MDSEAAQKWAQATLAQEKVWDPVAKATRVPTTLKDLLDRYQGRSGDQRRAALIMLGKRPLQEWVPTALKKRPDEVAVFAFRHGYKAPGTDPFAYLGQESHLGRPWTHGLGLHLEGDGSWRFQWIPSPALMGVIDTDKRLPQPLERAAQPNVLIHMKQLKQGLLRLKALGGDKDGLGHTLADGTRAGFLLRHVEAWLTKAAPALDPLANREAWLLHYSRSRGETGPQQGTLVFLPGDLPARAELALGLLKLNPFTKGIRSRSETWRNEHGAQVTITQIRGSGGVLHLYTDSAGTWISDREAPLRSLLFPDGSVYLAERPEWCKVALAAELPGTTCAMWVLPALGGGAAFEREVMLRRKLRVQQGVWPNPFVAKAAPRTGTLSLALGAGPTEVLLRSLFRVDEPYTIEDPMPPAFAQGNMNAGAKRSFELDQKNARERRDKRNALREALTGLEKLLDLRGAAFVLDGFVRGPVLSDTEKATLATYKKLHGSNRAEADKMREAGKLAFYGGFTEPGFSPAFALALPIQEGKAPLVQAAMDRIWPMTFQGRAQRKAYGDVEIRRIRTGQALAPAFVVAQGHLLVGTDEAPVAAMLAGLRGQAPTLADWQSTAYGRAEMDGPRAAKDLEQLLVSYLQSQQHEGLWDRPANALSEDEAQAEVAATFSPFLGAIKALGRRSLELQWTQGGLEARPK